MDLRTDRWGKLVLIIQNVKENECRLLSSGILWLHEILTLGWGGDGNLGLATTHSADIEYTTTTTRARCLFNLRLVPLPCPGTRGRASGGRAKTRKFNLNLLASISAFSLRPFFPRIVISILRASPQTKSPSTKLSNGIFFWRTATSLVNTVLMSSWEHDVFSLEIPKGAQF